MTQPTLTVEELVYGRGRPLFSPLSFCCKPGEIWAVPGRMDWGKAPCWIRSPACCQRWRAILPCRAASVLCRNLFVRPLPRSVHDVVLMGRARHVGLLSMPSDGDNAQVDNALRRLNIHPLAHSAFLTLSGGQQQLSDDCPRAGQRKSHHPAG